MNPGRDRLFEKVSNEDNICRSWAREQQLDLSKPAHLFVKSVVTTDLRTQGTSVRLYVLAGHIIPFKAS
jgi:hypothetical protein